MISYPTISVVIPVFNSALTMVRTINSIIEQTYYANEIIVVNNNSTDNLISVIEKFGSRVSLVNCEQQGVSSARNLGVEIASSEYVAFLDSDDFWMPKKLEMQVQMVRNSHSQEVIFGCYADFILANKTIGNSIKSSSDLEAEENFQIFGDLPCMTSSWVISREQYLKLGGMNPEISSAEDFEFACRAVKSGFRFKIVRERLVGYRISEGSITHSNYLQQFFRAQYYHSYYFKELKLNDYETFRTAILPFSKIWRRGVSNKYIRLAMINYANERQFLAAIDIIIAFVVSPKSAIQKFKRQFRWMQ